MAQAQSLAAPYEDDPRIPGCRHAWRELYVASSIGQGVSMPLEAATPARAHRHQTACLPRFANATGSKLVTNTRRIWLRIESQNSVVR